MSKAIAVAAIVAFAPLPEACSQLLHKREAPKSAPVASADLPLPETTATTPPIYRAPEAPYDAGPPAPPPSAEYTKARAAADASDWKKVRSLLDKRVHGGKAPIDEAVLLVRACRELRDKTCTEYVRKTYPKALM